jgi:isopentenyl diphosphate isomerase/L-lactate dehydrogenase-like FMN-dependent dehydrogenase
VSGSSSIEEVATANKDGKRWYQLYWPQDNDITLSLLRCLLVFVEDTLYADRCDNKGIVVFLTEELDWNVLLFGQKYDNPLIVAPVGVQGIFHEDKETGLAEVCEVLFRPP